MSPSKKAPVAGLPELIVFFAALVAGTACSLTSKVLLSMESRGMTGEVEAFSLPLFQTLGMFVGMLASLPMHWLVLYLRIPFYGYSHLHEATGEYVSIAGERSKEVPREVPLNTYLVLVVPAVFDLIATALAMFGLQHVSVSMYQILRGSCIVFTALANRFILQKNVRAYQWVGIAFNVLSIVLVGLTATLKTSSSDEENSREGGMVSEKEKSPLLGIMYILMGAIVQSFQYVFEERAMSEQTDTISVSPLLLTGMEGFWGTLICLLVLYPLAYYLPGTDHGSIENPFNTWALICNSAAIQNVFLLYFFSVFAYNILALLVTKMMDSVWHAILDNFRPITVWFVDLIIFYAVTRAFGEPLSPYSWLQLIAVGVLIYGTLVYNAPNSGSLELRGGIQSCYFDFSAEYEEVRIDDLNEAGQTKSSPSPYFHTMTPIASPSMRKLVGEARDIKYGAVGKADNGGSGISMQHMQPRKTGSFA